MFASELLRSAVVRFPDRPAIIAPDVIFTYSELETYSDQFTNWLAAERLGPGDRIAILARNLPHYPVIYFGAAKAGVVLVNASTNITAAELQFILDEAEPSWLFFDPAFDKLIASAMSGTDGRPRTMPLGSGFFDLLAAEADDPRTSPISIDDPFCMSYTSGTTGQPKAVVVSQRARCELSETVALAFGFTERDVVAVATPLFHTAGLWVCFQPAIALGCTTTMVPGWNAEAFTESVEKFGVTATLLVPTQLVDLLAQHDFEPERLSNLTRVVYAGAPTPDYLLAELQSKLPWIEFIENYGQSEIGPATVRRGRDLPVKAGSIGKAIDGVELAVIDERGGLVGAGQLGELVSRGPYVFTEYYNRPEMSAEVRNLDDDWVRTGDLVRMDQDGFITLVDRLRDIIVSGAENIYPVEIEQALRTHPAVADCAVFGIPDARLGELPAAHVELRPGAAATADELISHCIRLIARHKRPRLVELVDQLPRTSIGKVKKHELRAPYWAENQRRI